MKILYGIQCTGNGHLTRSLKIIKKLKSLGHIVDILLSGKNTNIEIQYEVKYRFKGFTFYNSKNGGIDYLKTITAFDLLSYIKNITSIKPSEYDKVISDFEPITAWVCYLNKKDCYGISNQCSFLTNKTPRCNKSIIGEIILKWMAPVSIPIGLHFNKYDSFIEMPLISDDVIDVNVTDLEHYTIYLPSYNLSNILYKLSTIQKTFHVFHRDIKTIQRYKNCLIYPIDKKTFINSFINCHGIITNAGFQTSSEALYMGKKLMVIPTRGQYEQECNITALKEMNIFTGTLDDIDNFILSEKVIVKKWEDPINNIIHRIFD